MLGRNLRDRSQLGDAQDSDVSMALGAADNPYTFIEANPSPVVASNVPIATVDVATVDIAPICIAPVDIAALGTPPIAAPTGVPSLSGSELAPDSVWYSENNPNFDPHEPADFVTSGGKWGPSSSFGTTGGTVTWSIAGAGLSNQTGSTFFTGTTVSLANFMPSDYVSQITAAFSEWAHVANINFVQVADGGGNFGVGTTGNIRIGGGFIDGYSASGSVVGRAFFPGSSTATANATHGDLIFDSGDAGHWNDALLYATALHEIGHSLGLNHSPQNNPTAVMNPTLHIGLSLQADDIAGIRTIYGSAVTNHAPVATINDHSVQTNDWSQVSNWISYSDADGNAATQYAFWDNGSGATSGYFWTPGNAHNPAGSAIIVSAADIGNVWLRGGQSPGSETMYVAAFDGTAWSAWDSFNFTTTANTAPVATIADHSLASGQWAQVANWLSYSDVENNAATLYQLWDGSSAAGGARFWTPSGGYQAAGGAFTINPSDLASVWVGGGTVSGTETMYVRAFDGHDWSNWDSFNLTTIGNTAPVATINDHSLAGGQWSQVASWISYSDANGDAATLYQFWDGSGAAGGARFWTPSGGYQAAGGAFTINSSDLGNVWVGGGTVSGTETMYVRAYDGHDWSNWDTFNLTTVGNTPPSATIADHSVVTNQWTQAASWISYSDAESNAATWFQFFDAGAAANSGKFWTASGGFQGANTVISVAAADINNIWVGGATAPGSETMYVRAYDGHDWGAWDPFLLTSHV